jgi:hypothetical protein
MCLRVVLIVPDTACLECTAHFLGVFVVVLTALTTTTTTESFILCLNPKVLYIYTYLDYQNVCPFVRIGTPYSLSRKQVCPPRNQSGGHTRLRLMGWGGSQFRRLEKKPSLLCGLNGQPQTLVLKGTVTLTVFALWIMPEYTVNSGN